MLPMKRRPTHPGEMLREDFLPDYGLTASGFAKSIGVSRRTVNELLHERRGVSARMALFLSRFFGNSPEFWLNAQRNVDLWDALQRNRKKIDRIIPVNLLGTRKGNDRSFLKRIAAARKSLRSGKGIRLEDCRMRSEYDFKSGVRGKYAMRHGRDGSAADERDAKILERNSKILNKEARDVMNYQVLKSPLGMEYMTMSRDEERESEALEWSEGVARKDNGRRKRLARECAKIDPRVEKAMAEEGYLEKRVAKGSRRGFVRAMKTVRNVKPARKDAL